jgi:hypothetical protein
MKKWVQQNSEWMTPILWVAVPWVIWWIVFGAPERTRNESINPAVYQAFRSIETQCFKEVFPHQTVRCQSALKYASACTQSDNQCDVVDYYNELTLGGFNLPSLYLSKP